MSTAKLRFQRRMFDRSIDLGNVAMSSSAGPFATMLASGRALWNEWTRFNESRKDQVTGAGVAGSVPDFYRPAKRKRVGSGVITPITGSAPAPHPPIIDTKPHEFPELVLPKEMSSSDNACVMVKDYMACPPCNKLLAGPVVHHYRNDSVVCESEEGTVKNTTILVCGSTKQWTQSTAAADYVPLAESAVKWFDLNPMQGTPAGARYTAATAMSQDTFYLAWNIVTFEFQNLENNPVFLSLTGYVAKSATGSEPELYEQSSYTQTIQAPDAALVVPAFDTKPSSLGTNFGVPNTSASAKVPWLPRQTNQTVQFKAHWKTLKTWKFQMAVGQRIVFKIKVKTNMYMDSNALTYSTYPKGCVFFDLEQFGSTSFISTASSTTAPDAHLQIEERMVHGQSKVGVLATQHLMFRNVEVKLGRLERYTAMYNIPARNTIAREVHMDTDVDASSNTKKA